MASDGIHDDFLLGDCNLACLHVPAAQLKVNTSRPAAAPSIEPAVTRGHPPRTAGPWRHRRKRVPPTPRSPTRASRTLKRSCSGIPPRLTSALNRAGKPRHGLAALLVVVSVATSCSSNATSNAAPVGAGQFRLDEWSIKSDGSPLSAGRQTIKVSNAGHETHELIIVSAKDASSLPRKDDGSVDEEQLASVTIGEIADISAGASAQKSFTLPAGRYVAFCNVVDQMGTDKGHAGMGSAGMGSGGMGSRGMAHVHFSLGMHTTFTVVAS